MRAFSAPELLAAWEMGSGRSPAEQALILLTASCPELAPEGLASLSIGERDARLLTLRECTFGPHLEGLLTCPTCAERLELNLTTTDLISARDGSEGRSPISLDAAGYRVQFRLPTSVDLTTAGVEAGASTLHRHILERCLLSVQKEGREVSPDQLPDEVAHTISENMARVDPPADLTVAVTCAACGNAWKAIFDIVTFFWREISTWCYRLLDEVHALASAYGWREADILAMSSWRRQYYLELAGT